MTDLAIGNNRSNEYTQLLEELRHSIRSTADIASKIYEQGKKDGLSNETIELALEGVINGRQLMNVLPLELKRKYTIAEESSGKQMIADLYARYEKLFASVEREEKKMDDAYAESDKLLASDEHIEVESVYRRAFVEKLFDICSESGLSPDRTSRTLRNFLSEKIQNSDRYDHPMHRYSTIIKETASKRKEHSY